MSFILNHPMGFTWIITVGCGKNTPTTRVSAKYVAFVWRWRSFCVQHSTDLYWKYNLHVIHIYLANYGSGIVQVRCRSIFFLVENGLLSAYTNVASSMRSVHVLVRRKKRLFKILQKNLFWTKKNTRFWFIVQFEMYIIGYTLYIEAHLQFYSRIKFWKEDKC